MREPSLIDTIIKFTVWEYTNVKRTMHRLENLFSKDKNPIEIV